MFSRIGNLSVLFTLLFGNNPANSCETKLSPSHRGKYGLIRYIYLWMEIFRFTRGSRIKSSAILVEWFLVVTVRDFEKLLWAKSHSYEKFRWLLAPKGSVLFHRFSLYFSRSIHTHTHTLLPVTSIRTNVASTQEISGKFLLEIFQIFSLESSRLSTLYRAPRFNLINRCDARRSGKWQLINESRLNFVACYLRTKRDSSPRCDSIRRDNIWTLCNFQPTHGRANGAETFWRILRHSSATRDNLRDTYPRRVISRLRVPRFISISIPVSLSFFRAPPFTIFSLASPLQTPLVSRNNNAPRVTKIFRFRATGNGYPMSACFPHLSRLLKQLCWFLDRPHLFIILYAWQNR